MVESRPLYLPLLCLIMTPLRLQRRYHADPLLNYAAIVVYILCMPIANQAVASSLADQDQPTHHTIRWWRVDLYTSCYHMPHHDTSSTTATVVPRRSIAKLRCNRRLHMYAMPIANQAVASSLAVQDQPTHHTIPYDGGESTSIPPAVPHHDTSSTTATVVPRRPIAKLRCN